MSDEKFPITLEASVEKVAVEMTPDRLRELIRFSILVASAMADVGCPDNVPMPDYIRKEIRPDPAVVERIVKMVEALARAGGGSRATWAVVIEAAIMDEKPAIEEKPRIIKPRKPWLH